MLEQSSHGKVVTVPKDRRSNPFIRTRHRKNFDRRRSFRVGTQALAFVHGMETTSTGSLKNISDSGACLELEKNGFKKQGIVKVAVPVLQHKTITCRVTWSQNGSHNGLGHYGVEFLDLEPEDKKVLRKRFVLDEALLASYARGVMDKTGSTDLQHEIRSFFLIDVKKTIETLIDVDAMVEQGDSDTVIMPLCRQTLDRLAERGDRLERILNNDSMIKEIKQRVRALLGHFLYQSKNFKRGFEKPRGYPGDYEMLEIVYNDREISTGLGKYIDRYGLDVPYSEAIRMRKNMMKDILFDFIGSHPGDHLNILNLASGACRDIRELFDLPVNVKRHVTMMCVDQDDAALSYSREKLSEIDTGNIEIRLLKGNILKLEQLALGSDNSFDMVYSIGIADYLQDRSLKKIFSDCYKKLKPGGHLVVAYKDKERHKPLSLNWYADWNFIPRNEEELVEMISDAMGKDNIHIAIRREPTEVIFFADIKKIK